MARATNAGRVAVILLLAAVAAAVSNVAASTSRKLAWVGAYPRALELAAAEPAPRETVSPATSAAPATGDASTPPQTGAVGAVGPDLARAFPPHPDKAAIEIPPADVLRLYREKMLFLDARRSSVYADGHIAGARIVPVWESDVDDRVRKLFEEGLDQRAPVVAYCSGGNCEDSHMLAEKLYKVGFDNVLIYKDGFPDWQKRGLPVSKGANP
ncbi:MAG: rhodanese-like domain-containing protein [Acidobacteriota bacterium]